MSAVGVTGPALGRGEAGLVAAMEASQLEQTGAASIVLGTETRKAPRPIPIKPSFDNMPAELKALPNWVCWRYLPPKSNGKKWRKIPFQPNGHTADTTDRSTWSTFEACRAAYTRGGFDGVGFVFDGAADEDGLCYCGVDFDGCIDPANQEQPVHSIALGRIRRLSTYTERSPSGTGFHCIVRANPLDRIVKFDGVEVYSTARFFTFTGKAYGQTPIMAAPIEVAALVSEVRAKETAAAERLTTTKARHLEVPDGFDKPAEAFASLDPAQDKLFGGTITPWFESLTPRQKDEVLEHALETIAKNTRLLELEKNGGNNAEWYKLTTAVARSGAPSAEDIFIKYASGAKDADPDDALRRHFARCGASQSSGQHGITVGTLLHVAQQNGATFDQWKDSSGPSGATSSTGTTFPSPLSMRELVQGSFPIPCYLIENLILQEHVNLLYGDGSIGKTLLAQHMAIALAAGKPLFDLATKQTDVLLVLAEDGYGITKERFKAICEHLKIDRLEDLPIETWCLPAHDISIARVTDQGDVAFQPFYGELTKRLAAKPGRFVVLDSMADIAVLNEEKRLAVNAFLKRALGSLCEKYGATVLVLGHPSKTSMADGTMYSGSTAFNNAVRNRITLAAPNGTKKPDRILETAKANYAALSSIKLFLWDTVFLTQNSMEVAGAQGRERDAVISTVKRMLRNGVRIVRGNGAGQKMRDVASEVSEELGLPVTAECVRKILNAAECRGELRYQNGKGKQLAGFVLPEDGVIEAKAAGVKAEPRTRHQPEDAFNDEPIARASAQAQADMKTVKKATGDQTGSP